MNGNIYRGEIYYICPAESVGCEQWSGRPGIIVSNEMNNQYARTVEVVFLTTRDKKPLPTHVHIESSKVSSTALCEQVHTIDKERIGNYVGTLTSREQEDVDSALQVSVGIGMRRTGDELLRAWQIAARDYESQHCSDDKKVTEKKSESVVEVTEAVLAMNPAYIRAQTERDIYKELYMNLLASANN